MLRYLVLLLCFVSTSLQQKDPLKDFCRRFGSQSSVVDDRLYLDGGLTNWNPIAVNPRNLSNTWLLWHDLTQSPDLIGVAPLHANLSKNSSIPAVSGGSFWADEVNKRIYLYGGDYLDVTPNQPKVLSYDIINDVWQSEEGLGYSVGSVAWGGSVGISNLGRGYVLGGWMSNNSIPGWAGGPIATSYLLEYDMISGDWQNRTGPNNIPKAEGTLHYLPISNAGVLVYFGGGTAPYGNDTLEALPMSTIYIYDIKSSQWYEQQAGGDVPGSRRRFCAGVGESEDGSSYNIYLYGGLGFGSNFTGYDDVYILSLPSFKWVKYWEGTNSDKPHHSMTCNVIRRGQMAIIGGSFPLTDSCDSPSTWGYHNLDLGKVSGSSWVEYRLNITKYAVPPEIVAIVGGSSSGGATVKTPQGGFKNFDLDVYFRQRAAIPSRTPTRAIPSATASPTSSSASKVDSKVLGPGIIAGIAVGGALLLFAIFILAFFLIRRRRKNFIPSRPPPQSDTSFSHPYLYQSSNHPQFSASAPSHQLESEPRPVELSATHNNEIIRVDGTIYKDAFPFSTVVPFEGGISPQSYGGPLTPESGTGQIVNPAICPHHGSFPSDVGSVGSERGDSMGTVGRQLRGVGWVSPQLTASSIERPKFKNQTYYSP